MFLHLKIAKLEGCQNAAITSEDTNVFVLAVCVCVGSVSKITIYQKYGTAAWSQFVNISAISYAIGSGLSVCLPGLHAYTGYNTIRAVSGKGKLKSRKLLQKEEKYKETFWTLGTKEKVSSSFYY